ncbi:MAG: neutral zinc metallopeptidase [Acidimicrobiales bacterium]|nr:neutral zinc metallopeptidase [Acidimicrobiales bacterium]
MVKFRNSGGGLSRNLEDRRGRGGMVAGGGAVGIIGLLITLFLNAQGGGGGGGIDITDIFSQIQTGGSPSGTVDPADEPLVEEMSQALDDIQSFWATDAGRGASYQDAKLVLFTNGVSTGGCGNAPSSVGPFYCPGDSQVYIDLAFFKELARRFGAPGDFARVYVLAHEIGHHVQNLDGTNQAVRELQQSDPSRQNELSVRMELQADCFAGVWGSSAQERGLIEPGDLEEGLGAAAAVGDDRIQEQAGADVEPESWTHGSSDARRRWFRAGFDSGDLARCDTFTADPADLGL